MDTSTAATLIACARQYAEHGRSLGPELRAELERIAADAANLPDTLVREAAAILEAA